MWGQAGGQTKIETAKQVMQQAVPALPPEVRLGLVAYGHRVKGDCSDVETLVPAGGDDRQALLSAVAGLSPKGKTPMAASVQQTARALKTKENETTIVLVSDGIETCHDDPCAAIKELKQSGVKFVLHVVGFDVDARGKEQLSCLAQAGGGKYFSAGDAAGLMAALEAVQADVAQKVEKAKTKKVATVSKLGKLEITLPQGSSKSLAGVKIVRESDGKVVKETEKAAGTHPLLAGDYQVVLLYAKPNHRDPDQANAGVVTVEGGRTATLALGAVAVNIAQGLGGAVEGVGLVDEGSGRTYLNHHSPDNDYYLFKTRPVPAGVYTLTFTFGNSKEPSPVAGGVEVSPGQTATVTLDSGIQLKKSQAGVQVWELRPAGGEEAVLAVKRRWDNQYPLWKAFPVQPGSYDLWVKVKGMDEPLPVAQGLEIPAGQTLVVDTGL
jgi:hypothetical protein